MDIGEIVSRFVPGHISAQKLTSVAEIFLQEGYESPSLKEIVESARKLINMA